MKDIEYLYHYTSIETLALILKNRTFRFNSLNKVDDIQEQEAADIKNAGQFCYVSSWTDDATESIPMWNMYATPNSGVRIKLRKNPFKMYENNASELAQACCKPVIDNKNGSPLKSLIPLNVMFQKGFICPMVMGENILHKVEYTSNVDKLYPKLVTSAKQQFSVDLGAFGKCKNLHWKFQNEWRYILIFLPLNLNQPIEKITLDGQVMANEIRLGVAAQPFPFYDLVLDDEAFREMEITLSPRITAGNRIIVENLAEKYNSYAHIFESTLVGLI